MTTTDPDLAALLTHPDALAFRSLICHDPGDDTARLVFADWLDENGDAEWAEYVRVGVELAQIQASVKSMNSVEVQAAARRAYRIAKTQCALRASIEPRLRRGAKCERCKGSGRVPVYQRDLGSIEMDDCWGCSGRGWQGVLSERPVASDLQEAMAFGGNYGPWLIPAKWERGFISHITCTLDWWRANGARCVREWPVTSIECSDRHPTGPEGPLHCWQRQSQTERAWRDRWHERRYSIPDKVFNFLPDGRNKSVIYFPTEPAARAALSAACVAWARGQG